MSISLGAVSPLIPPRLLWQCVHCGARAWDRYGQDKLDGRWDEACLLNAYPVEDKQDGSLLKYQPAVLIDISGRLHPAAEVGAGMPYEAPPTYEEQIARLDRDMVKLCQAFKTNQFPQSDDPELLRLAHEAVEAIEHRKSIR